MWTATLVYTGYDEVPDVSNANIAYVLENDNSRDVAEIVYIIEGDIYDADAIFFVLTSTKKDSEKYDGDNYWQFDDMYVDGRHRTDLYVSYDALTDGDQLKAGVVYKVLKSIDGTYITEIEPVTNWDPAAVATRQRPGRDGRQLLALVGRQLELGPLHHPRHHLCGR